MHNTNMHNTNMQIQTCRYKHADTNMQIQTCKLKHISNRHKKYKSTQIKLHDYTYYAYYTYYMYYTYYTYYQNINAWNCSSSLSL